MTNQWCLGIDLGTTNSAAAIFDGEALEPVRTSNGSSLLPSVVRISRQGILTTGEKARRFLDKDPDNTRGGFKRLLGTTAIFKFPASGQERTPEQLSTEVLRTLLSDVVASGRSMPERAVVTVPALFELPQTEATVRAARAAGLLEVEMLQEPVASALASGFRTDAGGCWLVYDLGGGTFDASLVVSEGGMLSVVGHDGDNYLGGRDIDALMAQLLAEAIFRATGTRIEAKDPSHQLAWRSLLAIGEEAKIDLSKEERVAVTLERPLDVGGVEVEVDVIIERAALEELVAPTLDRSIMVCERLLHAHGRSNLDRVVLVGGPTAMPMVRARIAQALGPLAAQPVDPMTVVAQGAALFAAQRGLWCGRPLKAALTPQPSDISHGEPARQLRVKAPAVSTDVMPFIVASVVDPAREPRIARVRFVRQAARDHTQSVPWTSDWEEVDAQGGLAVSVELVPRRGNTFLIEAADAAGGLIVVEPSQVSILQGVTIGDPPVSRSIGVALANGQVHVYLEKGLPLPARRTFTHHTIDAVIPGQSGSVIKVPLVQGEYGEARYCRLIGALEIDGKDVDRILPAGTILEVTLDVDRGGRMTARAVVPALGRAFEQVASLVVPEASPEVLANEMGQILGRLASVRLEAEPEELAMIQRLATALIELERLVERAMGGDEESGQRARRCAIDLDAQVAELEARRAWPELIEDAQADAVWSSSWVETHGTDAEKRMLPLALEGLYKAGRNRSVRDLERQRRTLHGMGSAAFMRSERAFIALFHTYAGRAHEAVDLKEADKLVEKGRRLAEAGENQKLAPIVHRLAELLPPDAVTRRASHASGLR